ncbi:MAG: methyltransferase [Croceibacterium sp.]
MTEVTANAGHLAGPPGWLRPALLDRAEQVMILGLWALMLERVINADNAFAPLLIMSETAIAFFVLVRRPTTQISLRLGDWLLAITATAAPLLIFPGAAGPAILGALAIVLVFVGTCFQLWAKLALRRSFGVAPANRGIKATGPYRFMRHPMYAGYLASHIGLIMVMPSFLNAAIYAIAWWAQILRLLAEERLLSEDPAYRAFMQTTRYRLIPGLF